jgi:hypothetical protein
MTMELDCGAFAHAIIEIGVLGRNVAVHLFWRWIGGLGWLALDSSLRLSDVK